MDPKRAIEPGDRVIATVEGVVEEMGGWLWIRQDTGYRTKADLTWTRMVIIKEGQVE